MKIAVTGGAGFIGVNFVLFALEKGAEVVIIDSMTYAANDIDGIERITAEVRNVDVRQMKSVDEALYDCQAVVHLAAESHNDRSLENPRIFFESNVMGTLNVASVCLARGLRLHHVSTDEVFGDFALADPAKFDENSRYNPSSPYSASKAASDHLIRAWVRSFGLQATISICSNNFGPYQHSEKLIPASIERISRGLRPKLYGDGTNVRDWIHVDDHVSGIWASLVRGQIGETYLFGTRNERSNLEVIETILNLMGRPKSFVEFVTDRPGHDRRYAINPQKAQTELGWQPQRESFEEKLAETVNWYAED